MDLSKQAPGGVSAIYLNLARIGGAVALAALMLPWALIQKTGTVNTGADLLVGPDGPVVLVLISALLTLLGLGCSLMGDRVRGAAAGFVCYVIALVFTFFFIAGSFVPDAGRVALYGSWINLAALGASVFFLTRSLPAGWRNALPAPIRPYVESAPLAAFFLGVSSGYPFAMIGATLTTRLAQDGIKKSTVTAFALAFLVYNFKWLWAWVVDGVRLPILGRLGQRVSWLIFSGILVVLATANLAFQDPSANIFQVAVAAILLGVAGATYDIVIDGYRIELLEPRQLGVGSGMSQYGWRIGSVLAGALALVLAARIGWEWAYFACAIFALPAILTGLVMGEPKRHRPPTEKKGFAETWASIVGPFLEFFRRSGALLVLLFVLLHKIGDTLANLVLRLLLEDMGYTNDEVAIYDVGFGFWAYLIGIFVGGILYSRMGMKRSVLLSLVLMGVSNLSFALLAAYGKSNWGLAATMFFENFASGIGGVVVVAYFSALTDLRFTASQYALISAAASIVGRVLTGTTAGAMVESFGYVNFYLFTTAIALPGIILFWLMMRYGLIDASIGTAGKDGEGDARTEGPQEPPEGPRAGPPGPGAEGPQLDKRPG